MTTLGPWIHGMNNLRDPSDLDTQDDRSPRFLADAINVDITDGGRVRSRLGYSQLVATTAGHSLFCSSLGILFVDGGTLKRLDLSGATTLGSGFSAARPVSYVDAPNGAVYMSDGVSSFRFDGTLKAWGPPAPTLRPTLTRAAGGALPAGSLQVVATYIDADGLESGASAASQITVSANDVVTVAGIPAPPGIPTVGLYASPINGTQMFLIAALPPNTPYIIPLNPVGLRELSGQFLTLPPPGEIVREFNGRLLIASGSRLHVTEAWFYHLYDPVKNVIPFPAVITLVETLDDGFYVVAGSQTYFLRGTSALDCAVEDPLPYGAVRGTGTRHPRMLGVGWMSDKGYVIGDNDGKVENVQVANVAVPRATTGASMLREQNGLYQAVSVMRDQQRSALAARTFMDATVS